MNLITWRAHLAIWTFVHAFELLINIVFFSAVYLRTNTIGGWNIYEVVILLGYMELLLGLGSLTFFPMMYDLDSVIRRGDLERKLVTPLDIQFVMSFPWIDTSDIFSLITGTLLMVYGVIKLHPMMLAFNILAFIILLVSSELIIYSIIVLLASAVFKVTRLKIDSLFWSVLFIGKIPITAFKGATYFILMFIVPIGLVTAVPARTLAGVFDPVYFGLSVVFAVVLFTLSRKLFLHNVRNYSGVGS
jgi:ABC-2 type transport system permease protein